MNYRIPRITDESRVKAINPHTYPVQELCSGLFAIVSVDPSTVKNGKAEAIVISGSFANECDAWTDARLRMETI